jgi:hypothetical protein
VAVAVGVAIAVVAMVQIAGGFTHPLTTQLPAQVSMAAPARAASAGPARLTAQQG